MNNKTELRKVCLLNNTIYEYTLNRKNVKNLNLRIHKDGSLHVSAPRTIPITIIENFIIKNTDFILRTIGRIDSFNTNSFSCIQDGSIVYFWGKPYSVKIKHGKSTLPIISDSSLIIEILIPNNSKEIEKRLDNFYHYHAKISFFQAVDNAYPTFSKMGIPYPHITIRNMKTRWGSCIPSKNKITLNLQLIKYPPECLREVIYHEFCHYIHLNHSHDFYSLLTSVSPNWKEVNNTLKNPL